MQIFQRPKRDRKAFVVFPPSERPRARHTPIPTTPYIHTQTHTHLSLQLPLCLSHTHIHDTSRLRVRELGHSERTGQSRCTHKQTCGMMNTLHALTFVVSLRACLCVSQRLTASAIVAAFSRLRRFARVRVKRRHTGGKTQQRAQEWGVVLCLR